MREYCEETLIPHDLKADILSRLSAKTLCKFRCVSKQWQDIITDPYFVNMHRLRFMKQNPPLLLHSSALCQDKTNTDKDHYTLHLSTTDKNGNFYGQFNEVIHGLVYFLLSCCNLICLVTTTKQIYICNPSTQQLLRLPVSSHLPPKHNGSVGFGYLPTINTYKIVHIYDFTGSPDQLNKIECQVFTLTDGGGGHWRLIGDCPFPVFPSKSPVCVNGAIYWITWDQKVAPVKRLILAFDLENESLDTIRYPTSICPHHKFECLGELKGCLCLINWKTSFPRKGCSEPLVMEIWMLKDQKKHIWIKEYVIDFSQYDGNFDYIHSYTPLDEEDGQVLIDSHRDYLYYYNIQGRYFRKARKLNSEGYNRTSCLYFDGLFSLKS